MDQQIDPSTNQVIIIVEGAKEQVKFKKAYNVKAATALGIVHVMCGFISFGASIAVIIEHIGGAYEGGSKYTIPGDFGIFASLLFLLSGVLTISGARFGRKCLVVASMVTDIISAIAGGILLIISAYALSEKPSLQREYENHQNECHQNNNYQSDTHYYCDRYHYLDSPKSIRIFISSLSLALLTAMGATMLIIAIA